MQPAVGREIATAGLPKSKSPREPEVRVGARSTGVSRWGAGQPELRHCCRALRWQAWAWPCCRPAWRWRRARRNRAAAGARAATEKPRRARGASAASRGNADRPAAGAPEPAASGFPSIFPKPPALFGGSGEATATAFDARQRALADRVSAYLSNVRQLHGNFVQVGPDGSKSEGEFYLQKPGKVRFDYNPPSPIELIADGSSVVVRDRKLATQDLYPLSQTPLRFLLADRIDLMRDTNLVGVYADDVFVTVVIEERQILVGTTG